MEEMVKIIKKNQLFIGLSDESIKKCFERNPILYKNI